MYTISTLNKLISVAFCNSFGIDIRLCCCSWCCCCCCCSLMLLLQLGNFMLQFPLPVKRAAFAFYGSNSPGAAITRRVIANWLAPPPCPLWEWREVGEGGGRGWEGVVQEAWRWHWQYALCITYFPFFSCLPSFFIASSRRRGGDGCTCKWETVYACVCVLRATHSTAP